MPKQSHEPEVIANRLGPFPVRLGTSRSDGTAGDLTRRVSPTEMHPWNSGTAGRLLRLSGPARTEASGAMGFLRPEEAGGIGTAPHGWVGRGAFRGPASAPSCARMLRAPLPRRRAWGRSTLDLLALPAPEADLARLGALGDRDARDENPGVVVGGELPGAEGVGEDDLAGEGAERAFRELRLDAVPVARGAVLGLERWGCSARRRRRSRRGRRRGDRGRPYVAPRDSALTHRLDTLARQADELRGDSGGTTRPGLTGCARGVARVGPCSSAPTSTWAAGAGSARTAATHAAPARGGHVPQRTAAPDPRDIPRPEQPHPNRERFTDRRTAALPVASEVSGVHGPFGARAEECQPRSAVPTAVAASAARRTATARASSAGRPAARAAVRRIDSV